MTSSDLSLYWGCFFFSFLLLLVGSRSFFSPSWSSPFHFISRPSAKGKEKRREGKSQEKKKREARGKRLMWQWYKGRDWSSCHAMHHPTRKRKSQSKVVLEKAAKATHIHTIFWYSFKEEEGGNQWSLKRIACVRQLVLSYFFFVRLLLFLCVEEETTFMVIWDPEEDERRGTRRFYQGLASRRAFFLLGWRENSSQTGGRMSGAPFLLLLLLLRLLFFFLSLSLSHSVLFPPFCFFVDCVAEGY